MSLKYWVAGAVGLFIFNQQNKFIFFVLSIEFES